MLGTTKLDLFAGIPVTDYAMALEWYQYLRGESPAFFPHSTKAVWELAEHQCLYIVQQPHHAGHAVHTLFADDLDVLVAQIADRGLEPSKWETYSDGVRKITYRDPTGNEISFCGAPAPHAAL
ncbi:MAG: VOC family protein [Chloroflexota bacterium]|nr:VOC family protein [Chloroflexota bacterium]